MKSLITGAQGFIGSALARELLRRGDQVHGIGRHIKNSSDSDLTAMKFFQCDLRNFKKIREIVHQIEPDRVFHLAAQNNVLESFRHPRETMEINVNGTLNLFEAIRTLADPKIIFLSVGSSAEYGITADHFSRLTEDLPLLPKSPYGVSKVAQGLLAMNYQKAYGMKMFHVRPFAVIGPGKEKDVISEFCRGVVDLERTNQNILKVGHLEAERDFMDIRDFISALLLVAEKGQDKFQSGESFNICNGTSTSLKQVIRGIQAFATVEFSIVQDPSRKRPTDDLKIIGSNEKIRILGYHPNFTFQDTLRDTLGYWRER